MPVYVDDSVLSLVGMNHEKTTSWTDEHMRTLFPGYVVTENTEANRMSVVDSC